MWREEFPCSAIVSKAMLRAKRYLPGTNKCNYSQLFNLLYCYSVHQLHFMGFQSDFSIFFCLAGTFCQSNRYWYYLSVYVLLGLCCSSSAAGAAVVQRIHNVYLFLLDNLSVAKTVTEWVLQKPQATGFRSCMAAYFELCDRLNMAAYFQFCDRLDMFSSTGMEDEPLALGTQHCRDLLSSVEICWNIQPVTDGYGSILCVLYCLIYRQ